MTTIKELFPRPNISLNERALRPLVYGFSCQVFENDDYLDCCVFLDPDAYSMFNIMKISDGKLYRRINFNDIKNVVSFDFRWKSKTQ